MPPYYFREASEAGIDAWFSAVLDASPVPVLVYNFPKRCGFTISPELLARLSNHHNMLGAKDSSGDAANLASFKQAVRPEQMLLVGDETLLLDALKAGWHGTISGAANVVPMWLSQIVKEWFEGEHESAKEKFKLLLPVLQTIRSHPQPATNKALLHARGIIDSPAPRLPLLTVESVDDIAQEIEQRLGLRLNKPAAVR
jgi:4-hydroxy-tetrahydrodipicolinate synthase